VLLDTHVWLWAAEGETARFGPRTRRVLERGRGQDDLHVSAASIFEIAALYAAGRLDLASPAEQWIRASIQNSGLRAVDVSTGIAIDAGLIPTMALPDPFDRLIAATAAQAGMPLVTRDERILAYARAARSVRVVDAAQ
jgi:PIN domain nuclease of toxin-antitoxin system